MKWSRFVALLGFVFALQASAALAQTRVFLTSGTTWTVPADWNSQDNTVEIIGHGGEGIEACMSVTTTVGGGGGAYSKGVNLSLTPGATVNVHFGGTSGGSSELSDGVWFGSSTTVFAESGWDGSGCFGSPGGGLGGRASVGFGSTKFSGGNGSIGNGGGTGTGGGGGAAGLNGAGGNATTNVSGGAADAGFGGAGGSSAFPATAGGNGTEWDASHGSGGGGGSDATSGGAQGGLYGGGGGYGLGGTGGLIVITYTPRNRVSSGVF